MGFRWTLNGFQNSGWIYPSEFRAGLRMRGFQVDSEWVLGRFYLGFRWSPSGFEVDSETEWVSG